MGKDLALYRHLLNLVEPPSVERVEMNVNHRHVDRWETPPPATR